MDPCAHHFDPRLRPPSGPAAGACLPAQQTSSLTSSSPSCPARHLPAQQTPSPTWPASFLPAPEARVAGAGVRSAARRVPDLGLPGAQGGRSGTQEAFTAEQHPGPYPPPGLPATACPPCAPSAPRPRPVCAPSAPQASGGDTAHRTRRSLPPAPRPQPVGGGHGGGSAQTGRRPAVFRTRHPAGATRGGGCLRHPDLQATPRKLRATGYALGLRLSVSSSHCLKSLPGERGGHTPAPRTPHPAPCTHTHTPHPAPAPAPHTRTPHPAPAPRTCTGTPHPHPHSAPRTPHPHPHPRPPRPPLCRARGAVPAAQSPRRIIRELGGWFN